MDIAARLDGQTGRKHVSSLSAELSELRIPIISPAAYNTHKREMVRENRSGIYVLLGPILYAFSSFHFFLRQHQALARWLPLFCALLVVGSGAEVLAAFVLGYNPQPFVLLFFATAVPSVLFFAYCEAVSRFSSGFPFYAYDFEAATFIWERHTIDPNYQPSITYFKVPERLRARARRAGLIDGVQIEVERFYTDPLLFAVRRRFFFKERICIGGWDTGKPEIDNV